MSEVKIIILYCVQKYYKNGHDHTNRPQDHKHCENRHKYGGDVSDHQHKDP